MCGIWFSSGFADISNQQLEIISHRGPDNSTMLNLGSNNFIGHNRLSIIDLTNDSNQPMFSKDNSFVMAYNGEIYNYLELKKELEKLGHVFLSKGDTEVLLNSFLQWGPKCLERLNGMFAFVIYEKSTGKIFAARDRFGIKPLYYYYLKDKIVFCSEIKQITTLKDFKTKTNVNRAVDFISWRIFNHTNQTMFENVFQLKGGEYIYLNLSSINNNLSDKVKTWYSHNNLINIEENKFTDNENILSFKEKLEESVNLRLRSDVPIATALSGGIDSSALTSLVEQISPNSQTTFSSRSKNSLLDEYSFAIDVINKSKIDKHYNFFLDEKNIFSEIEKVVWHNDEPISSTSIVAQSKLFNNINSKNFKVAINGQGADEVLGTYGVNKPFYNELKNKKLFKNLIKEVYYKGEHNNHSLKIFSFFKILLSTFTPRLFSEKSVDIINKNYINHRLNPHNYLANKMGLEINNNLKDYNIFLIYISSLPMLLQYEDRTSMRYSIESRVPYLDYNFVEFVMSIPSRLKINNGVNKYILRESLNTIMPKSIYNRISKLGYASNQKSWAESELLDIIRERLIHACATYPFLKNRADYLINNIQHPDINSISWRIIIFDIWAKKYGVN